MIKQFQERNQGLEADIDFLRLKVAELQTDLKNQASEQIQKMIIEQEKPCQRCNDEVLGQDNNYKD